jgi:hypothetical protein
MQPVSNQGKFIQLPIVIKTVYPISCFTVVFLQSTRKISAKLIPEMTVGQ